MFSGLLRNFTLPCGRLLNGTASNLLDSVLIDQTFFRNLKLNNKHLNLLKALKTAEINPLSSADIISTLTLPFPVDGVGAVQPATLYQMRERL